MRKIPAALTRRPVAPFQLTVADIPAPPAQLGNIHHFGRKGILLLSERLIKPVTFAPASTNASAVA